MSAEILAIINSVPMWIFASILVALVLVQSGLFLRLCVKEAKVIDYPVDKLKSSFKVGFITAFGPSLANVVAMVSMMTVIGSPITWMRLSIIGAAPTELGVATITLHSQGFTDGLAAQGIPLSVISLVFLMMSVVGTGWLLVVILGTPSMGKLRAKIIEKDKVWFSLLTTATTVGLFANLGSQQLLTVSVSKYAALISAFFTTFIMERTINKTKPAMKQYSLTISIIVAMIVGGLLASFG